MMSLKENLYCQMMNSRKSIIIYVMTLVLKRKSIFLNQNLKFPGRRMFPGS